MARRDEDRRLPGAAGERSGVERRIVRMDETIATIIAEPEYIPVAIDEIARRRADLENWIRRDRRFLTTLEPYEVPQDAPEIAGRMARAGARMGVGPMAAVAGAIAECALRAMMEAGAEHAIVDNGGDIAMRLSRPATVGIFAGPSPIRDIALRFEPQDGIVCVCTSSGTVGHSLSFGRADAAIAIAESGALADAAATSLGNAVTAKDAAAIERSMAPILAAGASSLLVIIGDLLVGAGEVPEIVRVHIDYECITTG